MYNRMLSRKTRLAAGRELSEQRGSGRSTSAALSAISVALSGRERTTVPAHDGEPDTYTAACFRATFTRDIITKLGLRFLDVRHEGTVVTVVNKQWTDNPWVIE